MENYNQRSWFSKNWPWVLPLGCCSGCLILVIMFFLGIGATALTVFSEIKEMSPLEEVLVIVNENEKVTEILGDNIKSSGFPNGNIAVNNSDGEMKFSIELLGEKGEAILYVNGIRSDEKWIYEDLYLIIKETAEEINLLENEKVLESI